MKVGDLVRSINKPPTRRVRAGLVVEKKTCKSYTLVCMINTDWKVSLNGREPNIGEDKSDSE